jgi:large subunit ribosomal protein L18
MHKINHNLSLATKRKLRVRRHMTGTAERPRVSVERSNHYTSVQVIDDVAGKTLTAVSDMGNKKITGTKTERAVETTKVLAEQLKKLKINKVMFDRGAFRYHGRVKAVAETLRQQGIEL